MDPVLIKAINGMCSKSFEYQVDSAKENSSKKVQDVQVLTTLRDPSIMLLRPETNGLVAVYIQVFLIHHEYVPWVIHQKFSHQNHMIIYYTWLINCQKYHSLQGDLWVSFESLILESFMIQWQKSKNRASSARWKKTTYISTYISNWDDS